MALREVVHFPDPRLKLVSEPITEVTDEIRELARDMIEVMYDERYHEAGWMLQYLTLGSWLTLVQSTYGAAHLATARARWVAAAFGNAAFGNATIGNGRIR